MAPGLLRISPMRPNCHISERLKGCCDICGKWPNRLHMPEDLHGWYCAACCPACKGQTAEAAQPQPPREEAAAANLPAMG